MPPAPAITDADIATFRRRGFALVERVFTDDEVTAALEGVATIWPTYDEFVAAGRVQPEKPQHLFPWDHSGLNAIVTHPELISAAERITGCRDLVLAEAYLGNKYEDGVEFEPGFHMDWQGNTLGPRPKPDDFLHPTFFIYLDDVVEGQAPILMVPNGEADSAAVPIIAPAGSVAMYTIYTRHAASPFLTPGHRPALWVDMLPKHRIWDLPRLFTFKSGARLDCLARFITEAKPRQIELLGFPPVGDPLWTREFLDGMVERWPGFDPAPYLEASA
jgi:hypothetical protein